MNIVISAADASFSWYRDGQERRTGGAASYREARWAPAGDIDQRLLILLSSTLAMSNSNQNLRNPVVKYLLVTAPHSSLL